MVAKIILGTGYGTAQTRGMAIQRGSRVEVRTATGELVTMRALGGPSQGRDFAVVWVCLEDDWVAASDYDGLVDVPGIPWPAEFVSELQPALGA